MAVTLDAHELLALGALTAAGLLGGSLHAALPSVIDDQEEEPTVLAAHELQPGDTHPLLDPSGIDQSFTSFFFHPRSEEDLLSAEAGSDLDSDEEPAAPFLEQEWGYRDELFAVSTAAVGAAAWLWRQRAVGGHSEEMQSGDLILHVGRQSFPSSKLVRGSSGGANIRSFGLVGICTAVRQHGLLLDSGPVAHGPFPSGRLSGSRSACFRRHSSVECHLDADDCRQVGTYVGRDRSGVSQGAWHFGTGRRDPRGQRLQVRHRRGLRQCGRHHIRSFGTSSTVATARGSSSRSTGGGSGTGMGRSSASGVSRSGLQSEALERLEHGRRLGSEQVQRRRGQPHQQQEWTRVWALVQHRRG